MSAFAEREKLLLGAALTADPAVAIACWKNWASQIELEVAPHPELRLLTPVYSNMSRLAPDFRLPEKLKGKVRATFIRNNLLVREGLPAIRKLGERCPILVAKGMATCIRFDAWSWREMGDVDIHVPYSSFRVAVNALRELGWKPQYGMTWDSLIHRTSLRRSSWNFTQGHGDLDLHWRPQPETESREFIREMWATTEMRDCFGTPVRVQDVEHATLTCVGHAFKYGMQGDRLQAVVDGSLLLPHCNPAKLKRLIDMFGLHGEFEQIFSALSEVGSKVSSDAGLLACRASIEKNVSSASHPAVTTGMKLRSETALLRHPKLYRFWEATGRKARIEQSLIRWSGPFSKPIAWSGVFSPDYDLRDCGALDKIAGPGWRWPEANQTAFWTDRADARLLIPLRGGESYMVVLGLSEDRAYTSNFQVDVFANGFYISRMDLKRKLASSEFCFLISRNMLSGPWVELSFRPSGFRGDDRIVPDRSYLSQSIAARRLQLYEAQKAASILSSQVVSELNSRILRGVEPEAGKFQRIRARMDNSTFRKDAELPKDFDPIFYILAHRDLFEHEVDPFEHFVKQGQHESREWRH